MQYADFALWQREVLDPNTDPYAIVRHQSDFWGSTLAGMPEVVGLATDRPRTPDRSAVGARVPIAVAPEVHAGLQALARSRRTTVFTVVHTALTAALARFGAGPDVAIGGVVSGRVDPALDDLVGFFANTLVLRVDTSGEPSFEELLERAREADLAALSNQELPVERVVDLVNPERSFAHAPLVQVMLAFQVRPTRPPALAGLETWFETVDTEIAKFDLCFEVVETFGGDGEPAGLEGFVSFATDIFDGSTVTGLVDELTFILRAAAIEPARS